jgi:5-methylcytosine-specific restriction protein A
MPTRAPVHGASRARPADTRPSAAARGYDADWRRFRAWYAAGHPAVCVRCQHGGPSEDMHLDHIRPLEQGGPRLDEDNVQWLCHTCHNKKTAEDKHGRRN